MKNRNESYFSMTSVSLFVKSHNRITMNIWELKLYVSKKVWEDQFKSLIDQKIDQDTLYKIKQLLWMKTI